MQNLLKVGAAIHELGHARGIQGEGEECAGINKENCIMKSVTGEDYIVNRMGNPLFCNKHIMVIANAANNKGVK
jgi:hypothetical protein